MYAGTDAEGFAVYLFYGPMQPAKSLYPSKVGCA